jgi:hypothetical protein
MNADALALSRACTALWMATLSLMTAFMQAGAPAHRYLIARKIAKNLCILREQDCFTAECRTIFSNLSPALERQSRPIGPARGPAPRWHRAAEACNAQDALVG